MPKENHIIDSISRINPEIPQRQLEEELNAWMVKWNKRMNWSTMVNGINILFEDFYHTKRGTKLETALLILSDRNIVYDYIYLSDGVIIFPL